MKPLKLIAVILWLAANAWLIYCCTVEHIAFEKLSAKSEWVGTGPMNDDENREMLKYLSIDGLLAMAVATVVAWRRSMDVVTGAFRGIGAALISPVLMALAVGLFLSLIPAVPDWPFLGAVFVTFLAVVVVICPIWVAVSIVLPPASRVPPAANG